jgi:hypothetical protein
MKTILLSLSAGALVFALFLGAVRPRAQEAPRTSTSSPAPVFPDGPAPIVLEPAVEPIEAHPVSRIDPVWWQGPGVPKGKGVERKYFSRAYPQGRPTPARID